jgi:hypothetical protein
MHQSLTQVRKPLVSMKSIPERSIPLNPKRKSELIMADKNIESSDAKKKKMPPFIEKMMEKKAAKKPAGKMAKGGKKK